jgi:hypothetical protein
VGCQMFGTPTYYHECSLLLLHGHTPGIADTIKGRLRRKSVMWTWSEVMLVDSTFTRCKWSCSGQVRCWRSRSRVARRFDHLESRLTSGMNEVNYVFSLYNFGVNRLGITVSHSSSVILCLSVAVGTCVNIVATVCFMLWEVPTSYL